MHVEKKPSGCERKLKKVPTKMLQLLPKHQNCLTILPNKGQQK
jgi:hypothetical protein